MSLIVCSPGCAARQPASWPGNIADSMGCAGSSELISTLARCSIFSHSSSCAEAAFGAALIMLLRMNLLLIVQAYHRRLTDTTSKNKKGGKFDERSGSFYEAANKVVFEANHKGFALQPLLTTGYGCFVIYPSFVFSIRSIAVLRHT